jgi:hypothetical protein
MIADIDGHPFEVPEHLIDEIRAEACIIPPERWAREPKRREQHLASQRELIAGIIVQVHRWYADGADIDVELQERLREAERAYQDVDMPENITEVMLAEMARIVGACRARHEARRRKIEAVRQKIEAQRQANEAERQKIEANGQRNEAARQENARLGREIAASGQELEALAAHGDWSGWTAETLTEARRATLESLIEELRSGAAQFGERFEAPMEINPESVLRLLRQANAQTGRMNAEQAREIAQTAQEIEALAASNAARGQQLEAMAAEVAGFSEAQP